MKNIHNRKVTVLLSDGDDIKMFKKYFLKEVSYVCRGSVYLIKNTVNTLNEIEKLLFSILMYLKMQFITVTAKCCNEQSKNWTVQYMLHQSLNNTYTAFINYISYGQC